MKKFIKKNAKWLSLIISLLAIACNLFAIEQYQLVNKNI